MSLAAYKELRDHHEDRQDARIDALTAASSSRLDALEDKTRHLNLEGDGTGDEHHRHGRRLRATDRVTAEATGDAELECVSGTGQNATLELRDTDNDGFRLVSSSSGDALLTYRDTAGAPTLLQSREADGTITRPFCPTIQSVTPTGNLVREDRAQTVSASVTHKMRVGSSGADGFDLVATGDTGSGELAIRRVVSGAATNALVVDRQHGSVALAGGLSVAGSTALGDAATDTTTITGAITVHPDGTGRMQFDAGVSTAECRFFDNSSGKVRIGGGAGTSVLETNALSITGASAKVTAYLPFEHHQDIKSVAVSGYIGSHTGWDTLSSASYPTISMTVADGDWVTVSGNFAQRYVSYGSIGDLFRLSVRRGSSGGSYISAYDDRHVIAASGGDNSVEHGQVSFPSKTYTITAADAGTIFISFELIRRDSGVPAVTLVAEGTSYATQASRIQATRSVQVTVPKV